MNHTYRNSTLFIYSKIKFNRSKEIFSRVRFTLLYILIVLPTSVVYPNCLLIPPYNRILLC